MLFAHLKRILGQNRLKSRRSRGTNENICSQPQPKSSANWQKSLPRRSKREKGEQKGTRVCVERQTFYMRNTFDLPRNWRREAICCGSSALAA